MSDNSYKFNAPPIVNSSNRVNTSRETFATTKNRASLRIANILQAGQTMPIPCNGTQFYFRVATAELQCRPSGGVFSPYSVGQGMQLDEANAFSMLEVRNDTASVVVFELFVGFQGFIDNQLILNTVTTPQVAYPTYPIANAASSVAITDKSGTKFADVNGKLWYGVSRVAIVISNTDSGVTLLLQKAGSVIAADNSICAIFPTTSIRLDVSGNYSLNLGGANINAIVSEIYQAVAA